MAMVPALEGHRDGPLGRWIIGPLIGVAVLTVAATQLHPRVCGDGPGDDPGGVVFEILAGLAVLSAFAVGAWRALRLIRRNGRVGWLARLVIALLLLASAALAVDLVSGVTAILWLLLLAVLIVGCVLTFFSLFGLLGAMADGVRANEAGVELPAYFFGFALFVYPFVFAAAVFIAYACFPD